MPEILQAAPCADLAALTLVGFRDVGRRVLRHLEPGVDRQLGTGLGHAVRARLGQHADVDLAEPPDRLAVVALHLVWVRRPGRAPRSRRPAGPSARRCPRTPARPPSPRARAPRGPTPAARSARRPSRRPGAATPAARSGAARPPRAIAPRLRAGPTARRRAATRRRARRAR